MDITLRPAIAGDLPFARSLYLDGMREVTQRLLAWNEARQIANFDAQFVPEEVHIVVLGEQDIGWMQVAEGGGVFLKQFFVAPRFQRRGIGTRLLKDLIEHAAQGGKTVTLGVVKGNPAYSLYARHGFRVEAEGQYKVYMVREARTS
jgi:GNAT superfamily N-acetyltransferase